MSKFFGAISDEESSDSSDESSEEELEEIKEDPKAKKQKKDKAYLSDSSDNEKEERKILTPAQKLRNGLKKTIVDLDKLIDEKEFASLHTMFNAFSEEINKNSNLLKQCGIPNMLLSTLMKLEAVVKATKKSDEKNMTKNNKKNFGTLKNKLTKYIKKFYFKELTAYKEDPIESEPEEEEVAKDDTDSDDNNSGSDSESGSDESEESESEDSSEEEEKKVVKGDDSDDDEIDWEDSDEDSDESEKEDAEDKAKRLTLEERRKRWMKSPEEIKAMREGRNLDAGKKRERKVKEVKKEENEGEGEEKEYRDTKHIKETIMELDFSVESVSEDHLKKIKKFSDEIQELILTKMIAELKNKTLLIDALYLTISNSFAIIKGHVDFFLDREKLVKIIGYINQLLDLIEENVEVSEKRKGKLHIYKFFDNANRELHTAFQRLSPQKIEYIKRLQDEHKLLFLGERVLKHYQSKEDDSNVAKTSLILLNHLYSKHSSLYTKMQKLADEKPEEERSQFYILKPEETQAKIDGLVKNVFEEGYNRSYRIQATLYKIYHHAIHDDFYTARNLMSTSQISEKINKQDENTQILYNRTIVQIGLSAFRCGLFKECFDISKEIANYGRLKNLLGQSFNSKATEKQIRKEKLRYVPYHLHIDYDLVDFSHMVCAMLLEIPNISRNELYIKRNIISKPFRKLIDSADNALFNGPPEQSRDYVIYASRALYHGEWKKAIDYLFAATKVWKLIPGAQRVKDLLVEEIKEVAFKVLMFKNSKSYESYSITDLGNLFDLDETVVHRIISKIIVRERFDISIKKKENVVQINEVPQSETDTLVNILADKVRSISDHNQKALRNSTKIPKTNGDSDTRKKPKEDKKEDGEETIVT